MRLLVDVDVSGPTHQLRQMTERVRSSTMMRILADDLEDYEVRMFRTAGEGSWPRDDADTLEQKGGGRTLVDEGKLMRELTRARIAGDTVVVDQGSAFYARFLRDGDRGMPRRNPAPKPDRSDVEEWGSHLLRFITTGQRR